MDTHDDNLFGLNLGAGHGTDDLSLHVVSHGDGLLDHELHLHGNLPGAPHADLSLVPGDGHGGLLSELGELRLDLNGDGHPSVVLHVTVGPDGFSINPDVAADELWREAEPVVYAAVDAGVHFLDQVGDWVGHTFHDFSVPTFTGMPEIHGTPAEDMRLWDPQDAPNSCAVATSNMLFRSLGLDVGETALAEVFQGLGIYDPAQGTQVDQIADVLNAVSDTLGFDHHATEFTGANLHDLEGLLDQGIRPLLCVDPVEMGDWLTRTLHEIGMIPGVGHAVQLTGLIESPGGTMAVLNDPGLPNGSGIQVPWETLCGAMAEFGFMGVAMV